MLTRIYLKTAAQRKLTDSLRRLADTAHDNSLLRRAGQKNKAVKVLQKLLEQQPGKKGSGVQKFIFWRSSDFDDGEHFPRKK